MTRKRLNRNQLRNEINSALKSLNEGGCGCGCGGGPGGCGDTSYEVEALPQMIDDSPVHHDVHHGDDGMLSKDDALDLVSMVAERVSCPMTRSTLMDAVESLRPESHMDHDEHGQPNYHMDIMALGESRKQRIGRSQLRKLILREMVKR
tara:strand:- start:3376 stop:3822 length:447 start_codon:yes stop_codon:yes gene_type:complete